MSRVSPLKPPPESHRGRAAHRRINGLRDISIASPAFALKVSFQFCNEYARFGLLRGPHVRASRSVQDD